MVSLYGAIIFTIEVPYMCPTTDQQMKASHGTFCIGLISFLYVL